MPIHEVIGFIAAFFTTTAFLPQVIKSIRQREAHDLSYGLLILQSIGCLLWSVYGVICHSFSISIANVITFILVILVLMVKMKGAKT